MPIKFQTSTFGFDNVKKSINDAFDSSVKDGTNQIVSDAKALCVVPSIASTIGVTQNGKEFDINAGAGLPDPDAAAWHEFGTGNPDTVKMGESAQEYVKKLTQDWRDYASTFIRNGKGSIPANPYLYPAFQRMAANIENVIISKL